MLVPFYCCIPITYCKYIFYLKAELGANWWGQFFQHLTVDSTYMIKVFKKDKNNNFNIHFVSRYHPTCIKVLIFNSIFLTIMYISHKKCLPSIPWYCIVVRMKYWFQMWIAIKVLSRLFICVQKCVAINMLLILIYFYLCGPGVAI